MEDSNSAGSSGRQAMTFVVRLSRDDTGRLTGVVERVRTGEKARVDDLDAIGRAIAQMMPADPTDPDVRGPGTWPS